MTKEDFIKSIVELFDAPTKEASGEAAILEKEINKLYPGINADKSALEVFNKCSYLASSIHSRLAVSWARLDCEIDELLKQYETKSETA